MSQFQDLAELLDPYLPLPIRGKTYRIPSPSVQVGLRAQATVAIAAKVKLGQDVTPEDVAALQLDDQAEVEFTQNMLSIEVFEAMTADGLPWEYVRHAAKTAFMWTVADRDQAAEVWRALGNAPRPVPQDRKAPAKKTAARKPAKKTASGGRTRTASSRSSSKPRPTAASPGGTS